MYTDGTQDLMMMILQTPFSPPEEREENFALIVKKAKTRYFPVFEKVGAEIQFRSERGLPGASRGAVAGTLVSGDTGSGSSQLL